MILNALEGESLSPNEEGIGDCWEAPPYPIKEKSHTGNSQTIVTSQHSDEHLADHHYASGKTWLAYQDL